MRFGESGWKERYYQVKLHMGRSDREMSRYVVGCYVQGLCWVLMYYYQGVQDWGWFYPFHYAPCASDLVGRSGGRRSRARRPLKVLVRRLQPGARRH